MSNAGKLHLNVPAALEDVSHLNSLLHQMEDTANHMAHSYADLTSYMQGTGMDSATEFSREQHSAINSVKDVIHGCTSVVGKAADETHGYDSSIAGGLMTGGG